MQVQSLRPQKATPCAKTRHTTYRSFTSVHPFLLHSSPFYPIPQNTMLCNAFQSAKHPKSAPSYGGFYIPCNKCSHGPTCLSISNCILIAAAHSRVPILYDVR